MIRQPFTARTPEELIALLSAVATAILAVIIIMLLYFGREIIIPIALAILLSFVLAPLVGLLQRVRVPRGLAVVSVVIIAFAFIFAMGSLLATQLAQLAGDLPRYQSTISEKIQSFRETTAGRGTLERASGMLKDLSKELDKPKEAATALGAGANPKAAPLKPVPVEVRQPDPGALESLQSLISPLLHPLATTGIIVIFVIFILLQREDLRNRLIRLAGSHDLQRTTAALDDAASRLSRLFLIQLLLNGSFGIVIGTGLWLIGVPSAILWGILAAVLRFVPYIGAVIAAAFPSRSCSRRRSNLDHVALDGRAVCRGRADRWPCDRTDGLWTQHGALTRRCRSICNVLDGAVGPDWSCSGDAPDGVPGCTRAACRTSGVP